MKILWHRVIAFGLAVFAFWIFLTHREAVIGTARTMERIGPGHSPDEQTLGLLILALLCVTVVALVKILTHRRDD